MTPPVSMVHGNIMPPPCEYGTNDPAYEYGGVCWYGCRSCTKNLLSDMHQTMVPEW